MMYEYMVVLAVYALAYCVGSVPSGYLIARLWGIHDITQHGSGNIGATNVGRVLGKPFFFLVLICDAGKAWLFLHVLSRLIPALPLYQEHSYFMVNAAFLILLGNSHSLFLNFAGGKGVGTFVGILLSFNPGILLYTSIPWIIALYLTRTMGMASLAGVASTPLISWLVYGDSVQLIQLCALSAIWITLRHQKNIMNYIRK